MKEPLPLTVAQAVALFLDGQRGMIGERTIAKYRYALADFVRMVGDRPLDQVTLAALLEWRTALFDRGLAVATVAGAIQNVRRLFNWLEENDIYAGNPARKLKKPRLPDNDPKAIELDDIRQVLYYLAQREQWGAEGQAAICRDRALILFLADSGCRVGGLCSLNVGAVDLEAGAAIVKEKGRGGGKRRLLFFGRKTAAALKDWLHYHPANHGAETPLFISMDGKTTYQRLTISGVFQILRKRALQAGVTRRFNPHSFRHGAAREWLRNGADLATVSQLLGHAGIEVTALHYARWSRSELSELHGRFSYVEELAKSPATAGRGKVAR